VAAEAVFILGRKLGPSQKVRYLLGSVGLQGTKCLEVRILGRPYEVFVLPYVGARLSAGLLVHNLNSTMAGRSCAGSWAVVPTCGDTRFFLRRNGQSGEATQKSDGNDARTASVSPNAQLSHDFSWEGLVKVYFVRCAPRKRNPRRMHSGEELFHGRSHEKASKSV
jgi:hypothetical protein